MSSRNNILKNISSLGIIQIINYIFPLITVPYVANIIGPEGYGIVNYATAFIGYFTLLIAYGFDLTGTRKIVKSTTDKQAVNQIISEILSARILLFFVSLIIFVISLFYFKPIQTDKLVAVILFAGCIGNVLSPQYIYQGFQKLTIFAKINFVRGIINTALIFVLIKKPSDYIFLPVLSSIFLIISNLFLFYYSTIKFNIKYRLVSIKKALAILNDEKMIFFSTVVISLYTSTNTVVLGFFVDKTEVGYYTTSYSFLNIVMSVISMPISLALYPFIGKAFSESREKGVETVRRVVPVIFYITLVASLAVLFLAPILIGLFYGEKFDKSIVALQILAFQPLIIGMSNVFGIQLMLNMALDKLFFRTTLVTSILGVFLNLYMSRYYGYIGTAWNCVIVECFITLMMYFVLRRQRINVIVWENFKIKNIISLFVKKG